MVAGAAIAALTAAVLVVEGASRGFGDFFAHRPVEAGFLSGVLLTLVVSVIVGAILDSVRNVKWNSLSVAAFEALAHEVTIVIDTLNTLVTGFAADDGLLTELRSIGLGPVETARAHALEHSEYMTRLEMLIDRGFNQTPEERGWCLRAQDAIIALRVGYRKGLGRWAAALVATGELARMLDRLAQLNQQLSSVEEWIRLRRGRSGWNTVAWTPRVVASVWADCLGEALSLREDLWRTAKGRTDPVWRDFRNPAPAAIRDEMSRREAAWDPGDRRQRRVTSHRVATPTYAHPAAMPSAAPGAHTEL
jgi:hypothetical protein